MPEIKQDIRAATFVVAANDSLHKNMADYVCDGVNDHIEIQAALDALPATGGEVLLLDGKYNIEVSLVLGSNQTLRGCGRNTILTTTTAALDIITATGTSGNEKVGILIADLCIDGDAGGVNNGKGIFWTYVDHSKIRSIWSQDNYKRGIAFVSCYFNELIGNTCLDNNESGIYLGASSNSNVVMGNTCQLNRLYGIYLHEAYNNNVVTGNICLANLNAGIRLSESNNNVVTGNICQLSGREGITLDSSNNNIIAENISFENSQETDNTYDNISLAISDYNLITGNVCRRGALASQPQYGIDISTDTCDKNIVQGNDLHDAGKTANFNDAGTLTIVEDDNREIEVIQIKAYRTMTNNTGGALAVGDVVILKGVVGDLEIDTTAVQGDDKVYGMVAEAIADAASGYVQVKGKTTALKVNGAIDIIIGDPLGTFTAVGIAMQAQAGDMAFAIALEGYTTDDSGGVIDAYIKSPWD